MAFNRPEDEPMIDALSYLLRTEKANMQVKRVEALIGDHRIPVKRIAMKVFLPKDLSGFRITLSHAESG